MSDPRLSSNDRVGYHYVPRDSENISVPERELLEFIRAVTEMLGPSIASALTEIWLNEVACMDCTPGPRSLDWRKVSMAASTKLASQLIASQLRSLSDSWLRLGTVALDTMRESANGKSQKQELRP